ncbi:UDP-2,4-diacetamido-2,4,6-trideoxy-beta-L-altropyranose hydrolase [Calothrix sp. FACHB-1219]|uniref:UDP-2,4-diacetamido-2,4, 6-trideoxy-beta-L-altropyranose hydrolase n=1 Tax=unclassified Calothrix TaxID=2619626 RepID=UPI00168517E1|nr:MULTISPECIES: UDP-2,4-diacetamido-2,4,6-trideoxy-beta-L-altropyranose hydrolase [unclassified Calothrix]MBD2201233.1 UDP-2,4-diacetamido-2,4,6-trideoxy-beta-L-altropyranose hydrolase [Calothrix sp. FACHB-168]MBD2215667.1 UDP-2,4-diacetamido-2,4,6-trideoxy-beta-L-altropyranose hydrolase [Calothrix sp. FACHB-1219]
MKVVIRTDASSNIGTGHLMRCLALAHVWQAKVGEPIFVISTETMHLEARLTAENFQIFYLPAHLHSHEDARETSRIAQELNAKWVIVDGYNFDSDYQKIIKNSGLNLLFIDDYGHAKRYYADLVLNQNISGDNDLYSNRELYTQILLGNNYVLLRREFLQWKEWQRYHPPIASKLLITMGGADTNNVTLKIIQALNILKINGIEAIVVVGGSNSHYEQLRLASQNSQFPIRLEKNVTNMPELMAWADVAITAGGSTCWELAFMGLPSLILSLAENQKAIAQKLDYMGVSIYLGWHEDVSAAEIGSALTDLLIAAHTRVEMTRRGQELVDGEGSKRVLSHLEAKLLKLRWACQEDCRLLWEWSNDPEVRAVSFSTEPIPWEDHVQWFQSRLNSPNYIFYIGVDRNDIPIGQIRYELQVHEAIISINIDKKFRYQGYGCHLINLGCEKIFSESQVKIIHAYVKPYNTSSIKAFSQSGFKNIGNSKLGDYQAIHLVKNK